MADSIPDRWETQVDPTPAGDDASTQSETPADRGLDSEFMRVSKDEPDAPLVPGERIDDYAIVAPLKGGGMGQVYIARHLRLGREVALKVISSRVISPAAVIRFEREMRAAGRVKNHPNVILSTDAGESRGRHYLVMELVPGVDLADLVKGLGRLPIPDACELVRQAATGLQSIHEAGLVHRDIKPSNMMLTPEGVVKVLDLGLALLAGEAEDSLTHPGALGGTADYMAPEQALDLHSARITADLYSLGCTLYCFLAGIPPFGDGRHPGALKKLLAHRDEPVPPIATMRPELARIPELLRLLDRLLDKDPKSRPSEPREVADALARLAVGSDLPALFKNRATPELLRFPVLHPSPAPPGRRSRRLGLGCAALGLGSAVLLIAWVRGPGRQISTATPGAGPGPSEVRHPLGDAAPSSVTSGVPPRPSGPLKAVLDVRVWPEGESDRPGRRLNEPAVLPLKPGDLLHIEATVNRPAYLYMVWLDAAGDATPMWPWKGGDWNNRPTDRDNPRTELHIPEDLGHGMPLRADAPGVQVLMLLARETPLPADARLAERFREWPKQSGLDPLRMAMAAWFDDGDPPPGEKERAPFNLGETKAIGDPVWRARTMARGELQGLFTTSRIVCFTFRGQ